MGLELFDRYGQLRNTHKICGSCIWGGELGRGDILLFQVVETDKDYRRRGLASRLCNAVINAARPKCNPKSLIAVAHTAVINITLEKELNGRTWAEAFTEQEHATAAFLRSIGFRRVGTSDWFAFAGNDKHRSHGLSVADDFNPRVFAARDHAGPSAQLMEAITSDTATDAETFQVMVTYAEDHGTSPMAWTAPTTSGNTLLHSAAYVGKPICVTWPVDKFEQLRHAQNSNEQTPLAFCLQQAQYVETVRVLKGLTSATDLDLQRIKFGCTCGQCIGDFLSPRMRELLTGQAQILNSYFESTLEHTDGDGVAFAQDAALYFRFLPAAITNMMRTNKSVRQGFSAMFGHFAACLEAGRLPTEANVRNVSEHASEWPPVTRNYLERGGTIAAAGSCPFEGTMEHPPLAGDGFGLDCIKPGLYETIPKCRNDEDFGFVSGQCGYERSLRDMYAGGGEGPPESMLSGQACQMS